MRPLLILALLTVAVAAPMQRALAQPRPAADLAEIVRGSNAFAFDLYRAIGAEPDENIFVSPFSIHAALAMTHAGAAGVTAAEMAAVLGLTLPEDRLHAAYRDLYARLAHDDQAAEIAIANALWVARGFALRPTFVDRLRTFHEAPAEEVDMHGDAADVINAWTNEHTRGRIDRIVSRDALTDAALVLTNAIYFLGDWQYAFDPEQTRVEPFTLADGNSADVPLMRQRGTFRYAERDGYQVIDLPYEGSSLTMTVLLPATPDGLPTLVEALAEEMWSHVVAGLGDREVQLFLPRFEMTHAMGLRAVLESLGMREAFDEARADFSGMAALDGTDRLSISDVLHRAFIAVDEEGTEAAAATAVVVQVTSAPATPPPPPAIFRADRPFMFVIRDSDTGAILFSGQVADPSTLD